ncbi:MAG: site-specific integrase [Sedimenticola sp.]
MATIRKRGKHYHVQIRKKGLPPITKSFSDRKTASTFAKDTEAKIEKGLFLDSSLAEETTLSDVLNSYRTSILPNKRGKDVEAIRLRLLSRELGNYPLAQIQPYIVSQYRDRRLKEVKPATVRRELGLLSRVLSASEKEFGIYLPHGNPVSKIQLPTEPGGRTRRLNPGEFELLLEQMDHNPMMLHVTIIAIETGMRRGELSKIQHQDINWDKSTLHIPETKNGIARTIPLSSNNARHALRAIILATVKTTEESGRLITLKPHSITRAFQRACKRAGITDLRFHDLRHEATSRFFEKGFNVMEVASITGHQDLRMLRRYTHIRAESLVERL